MGVFSAIQTVFVVVAALVALLYSGKAGFVLKKLTELSHGKAGCAPVSDLGNVTLHYFAGRGRGEAIRMLLEEAEITYTETKFTKDTWPAHKQKGIQSGLYTYGQVPAIETTTGVQMTQSQAIAHYIGRATGMECDCEDLHFCEIIALGTEDARSKLSRMLYDPEFSMKDREQYLSAVMPLWLGYFEKLAPALSKQERAYFASDRLTWVDFLVFDLLDNNKEFAQYNFGERTKTVDVLAPHPKLTNFYQHFAGRPRISNYIKSKRRPAYTIPNVPKDAPSTSKKQ